MGKGVQVMPGVVGAWHHSQQGHARPLPAPAIQSEHSDTSRAATCSCPTMAHRSAHDTKHWQGARQLGISHAHPEVALVVVGHALLVPLFSEFFGSFQHALYVRMTVRHGLISWHLPWSIKVILQPCRSEKQYVDRSAQQHCPAPCCVCTCAPTQCLAAAAPAGREASRGRTVAPLMAVPLVLIRVR
jgi:hypothetical protein